MYSTPFRACRRDRLPIHRPDRAAMQARHCGRDREPDPCPWSTGLVRAVKRLEEMR